MSLKSYLFSDATHKPICVYKVKSRGGNKCADAIAKYQANQANYSMADTGIPSAGHGGNLFSHLFLLAMEGKRGNTASASTAPAPNPTITYLPNLQNALKSHMHTEHRLGYANSKTGYYSYYQSLLPRVENKISNAFRNMPCIVSPMKHTILPEGRSPDHSPGLR
eukprot:1146078-Pelagomonas_calceolata.AAC.1